MTSSQNSRRRKPLKFFLRMTNHIHQKAPNPHDRRSLLPWVVASVIWVIGLPAFVFSFGEPCQVVPIDAPLAEKYFSCLGPNELGDFLAGAFAPLAFVWLMVAVLIQSTELKRQAEELKLTRGSIDDQRKVMEQQREAMEAQADALKRQAEFMAAQTANIQREVEISILSMADSRYEKMIVNLHTFILEHTKLNRIYFHFLSPDSDPNEYRLFGNSVEWQICGDTVRIDTEKFNEDIHHRLAFDNPHFRPVAEISSQNLREIIHSQNIEFDGLNFERIVKIFGKMFSEYRTSYICDENFSFFYELRNLTAEIHEQSLKVSPAKAAEDRHRAYDRLSNDFKIIATSCGLMSAREKATQIIREAERERVPFSRFDEGLDLEVLSNG